MGRLYLNSGVPQIIVSDANFLAETRMRLWKASAEYSRKVQILSELHRLIEVAGQSSESERNIAEAMDQLRLLHCLGSCSSICWRCWVVVRGLHRRMGMFTIQSSQIYFIHIY